MNPIYLDYNATTPIDPLVAESMKPFLDEYFGNPSSVHSVGVKSKLAIEKARKQVAGFLNCDPSEIIFTSGGTESNNMAIKGFVYANKEKGRHIITSSVEHPAVYEVCKYLEKQGFDVTYTGVDEYGKVNVSELEKSVRSDTILITVMHANNEVGTIQPIKEISEIARKNGIALHTDAAQSAGKIEVDVERMQVDMLSLAGHKIYAPKGVGALYIRNGVRVEKQMHGADHEQNMRAGTENVLEIVGLGKACEIATNKLGELSRHYRHTRDELRMLIEEYIPGIKVNGHPEECLPNTLSVSFPGVEANTLISRLEGVAASAGAACHAESIDVSAVLEAMKLPIEYAMGTIRFSTGRANTMEEIKKAATEISSVARNLLPGREKEVSNAAISNIKLTHYTHGLGCACKIEPRKLEKVLESIPSIADENVLIGIETSDDAAVYRLDKNTAIVQTLDFFTPVVDDPYDFGAIAAANALSDIYAMGAKPLFALNIVGFPEDTLPMQVLEQILKGAADKAHEAGINVLGGHTIEDPEPKYGMVVTGIVDPARVLRNAGAKQGNDLILTKPLGTGIITTGIKRGMVDSRIAQKATDLMAELNRTAAECMEGIDVSACTDVTGFGLLGHLREMSRASGLDAEIIFDKVPFIEGARDLATAGVIPGGTHKNLAWVEKDVNFGSNSSADKLMLADAQTSGGLLIAVSKKDAHKLLKKLHSAGINDAVIIGHFTTKGKGRITISQLNAEPA